MTSMALIRSLPAALVPWLPPAGDPPLDDDRADPGPMVTEAAIRDATMRAAGRTRVVSCEAEVPTGVLPELFIELV